uniref:Uncharacterized protein n=1 Tax=viral metagenome TaxID=1070528 RepID=A0A6C0EL88_9ZZZZ
MDKDIVPLCLYLNDQTKSSYIGFPAKKHTKDGIKFSCQPIPDARLVAQFYVVNPDITTRPPGMDLFCARDSPDSQLATVDLSIVYDPFHYQKDCIRFYAWVEPVPHATPLHVWKSGSLMYFSFGKEDPGKGFTEVDFSPIYVLIDPRIKDADRIKGFKGREGKEGQGAFEIKNNYPQFKFSGYQGRCIPDPNGMSVGDCTVLYGKNILFPQYRNQEPTLRNYIDQLYNKRGEDNFLFRHELIIGLVILFILLIGVLAIIRKLSD